MTEIDTMLTNENRLIDIVDLNRFAVGDEVLAEACAEHDRFEGVIIGIELQRIHSTKFLKPSITLLHDVDQITDGFKPSDLRLVRRALSSRTSNEAVVRVKPLEWHKNFDSEFLSWAETIVGRYRVWSHHEANGSWFWELSGDRYGFPSVNSEAEAKSAAQADFERRIRSALVSGSDAAVPGEDGWRAVPEEATQELLRDASSKEAGDKQVLCYENGEYYNAWLVFDPYEGGWIWMNEADSEPNPSHYRLLPAPPPPSLRPDAISEQSSVGEE